LNTYRVIFFSFLD